MAHQFVSVPIVLLLHIPYFDLQNSRADPHRDCAHVGFQSPTFERLPRYVAEACRATGDKKQGRGLTGLRRPAASCLPHLFKRPLVAIHHNPTIPPQ